MHLTLTVPHYVDTGFRGEKYYFRELIKIFNKMRKSEKKIFVSDTVKYSWTDLVYGGEYGVETTVRDNGLNIHIHSLLFVKKISRSRNKLHKVILTLWNELTVNEFSKRKKFTVEHLKSIKKGNKLLTNDFIINELNPQGATSIGLKTIFSLIDGKEVRSNEFNSDIMLRAVMETISYHFEPQAFDKKYNEFNLDLLADMLPKIYKQRLYSRFGCIQNESSLALSQNKDLSEDYGETKGEDNDGENSNDVYHVVVKPYKVFHDKEKDEKISIGKKTLAESIKIEAFNTLHALGIMSSMFLSQTKRQTTVSKLQEKIENEL